MFDIAHNLVYYGIGIILIAMFVRAVASWFGFDERFAIIRFCARISDPFLNPIRRITPRAGNFDISFIFTFFFLRILQILLLQSLPPGW